MGMAASQARLLTITARLSDNELRSQSINNAKMRLATQSAQASENYIKALNDANLMFNNYDLTGTAQSQLLTFNSLMMYSSYNNQYGLVDASGRLMVSESEAAMFELANGNLNAYLKSHGLEYTSTYFDELGTIVNEDYPEPFNSIDSPTLQKMYEAYGSYENSLEVENYKKFYSDFSLKTNKLESAVKEVLPQYFTSQGITPLTLNSDGTVSLVDNANSPEEAYNTFRNSFSDTGNPYCLEYLKSKGYINDENYQYLKSIVDSVKFSNGTLSYTSDVMTENNGGFTVTTDETTGQTTYDFELFSITVDSSGHVVSYPGHEIYDINDDGSQGDIIGYLNLPPATDSNGNNIPYTLENFLKGLTITDSADPAAAKVKMRYNPEMKDGKLSITETTDYTDLNDVKGVLNGLANDIFCSLVYDGLFNTDKFIQDLVDNPDQYSQNVLGFVLSDGEKFENVVNEYRDAREKYLKFITEESYDGLLQAFINGEITAKDSQDVDFVLKFFNEKNFVMSENYKTVVSEFIIDNMIENYGEPKYAWIDENDTANTGNADAKAQWYTNLFNRMLKGYKALENGLASSSEWIEYALESGIISMEQVDKSFNWKSIDYKTCANITEQTDNSAAVAKAEAEYTRAMNDIDTKDSRYDMELKNIDTEHSALQQEYEVLKGVISKNIERTFKFSQQG